MWCVYDVWCMRCVCAPNRTIKIEYWLRACTQQSTSRQTEERQKQKAKQINMEWNGMKTTAVKEVNENKSTKVEESRSQPISMGRDGRTTKTHSHTHIEYGRETNKKGFQNWLKVYWDNDMVRHLCTIKTRLGVRLQQPRRVQHPCIELRSRRSGLVIMWYCFKNPYHDNRYVHAERKTKTHRK